MTSSAWQTAARVALFGMVVNSIFAVAKILGGVFGHAYVLIADGIESGLDIAGSFVIWSGLKVAARPPDASHPYGHGKAEPIAAVIVAIGVLAAAVGLAIQSVREIFLPHHAPAPYTLVILIVVIVIKETLFRYVNRIGRDVESTAVQTDAWHHRSDALTSAAAFIGISAALIGGKALAECGRLGCHFRLRGDRGEWNQADAPGVLRNHGHRAAKNRQSHFLGCHDRPRCHRS